jgi:hypothetical protein
MGTAREKMRAFKAHKRRTATRHLRFFPAGRCRHTRLSLRPRPLETSVTHEAPLPLASTAWRTSSSDRPCPQTSDSLRPDTPAKWTSSTGSSGVSGLVRADLAISTTPVLSTASMRTLSSFRMTMWSHRFSTTPTTWRLLRLGSRDSSPTISWAWWCSPAHTAHATNRTRSLSRRSREQRRDTRYRRRH